MTQMDYVYCTQCSNFGLTPDLTPVCAYADLCDLWDPEDGRRLYMRPYYAPLADNVRSPRALITKIPNKDGTVDYYIRQDLLNDILRPFTVDEEDIDQDGNIIYYKHGED